MTVTATTAAAARRRRLALVPSGPRRAPRPDALLTRHRRARISVEGREAARAGRHAHLKRCYD